MSLSSKVAIVTGASSGIGAAIAVLFTKEGATVVAVGRNDKKLKRTEQQCEIAGKKPLIIKADISKDDQAKHVIEKTIAAFGQLDILINNAGFSSMATILDGGLLKAYDSMHATNLRAIVHLTELAAPHLIKTKGNIINISSTLGKALTGPGFLGYCATKAGLDHFTRGAAKELAPKGVRVNIVSPGPVATDFLENAQIETSIDDIGAKTPLGKASTSEDIADLVLFLISDKARSITGSDYVTDNGYLLSPF